MTDDQLADLDPGVSYAVALTEGIALRCNPHRNTAAVTTAARREANNLSRLIVWAVLPLLAKTQWHLAQAWQRIADRLQRFGVGEENHADYPEPADHTPLLLANFDELARRVEAAAERCEQAAAARVRARHHQRTAPTHLAWFDRPAGRPAKGGAR